MIRLQQSHLISAPRAVVETALLDPTMLRRAIPGCQEVRRLSPSLFLALVGVGFLNLKFDMDATLEIQRSEQGMMASGSIRTAQVLVGRVEMSVRFVEADGRTRVVTATTLDPARRHSVVVTRAGTVLARKLTNLFFTRLAAAIAEQGSGKAAVAPLTATHASGPGVDPS